MGIIWRVAMPLLSTLAALVILVSSAEDNLERDYQYELRPRALANSPDYDQAWRAIEAEPMMQPSTQTEPWHESMEEPLKRRRPFRKRKRRPIGDEEPASEEKQVYPEQPQHYQEQQYGETTEMPRRRRKKLDNRRNQWTQDYVEAERPFRKRSHRTKRPSLNGWRISEFEDTPRESLDRPLEDDLNAHSPNRDGPKIKELIQEEFHDGNIETRTEDRDKPYETFHNYDVHLKEDKSLSEFSLEVPNNKKYSDEEKTSYLQLSLANKLHEKAQQVQLPERPILISSETTNLPTQLDEKMIELSVPTDVLGTKSEFKNQITAAKSRAQNLIYPAKLKELLKRSNATSLSETLQQHNLSLIDLLSGRTNAVSVLKSESSSDAHKSKSKDSENTSESSRKNESTQEQKESNENKPEYKSDSEKTTEDIENSQQSQKRRQREEDLEPQNTGKSHDTRIILNENGLKIVPKRRFPGGIRRKLRLRPTIKTNSIKAELSRDLITQTVRKYHDNRNITKSKEWKEILPSMNSSITQDSASKNENVEVSTTTTAGPEETTNTDIEIYPSTLYDETETINERFKEDEQVDIDTSQVSTVPTQETTTAEVITTTEKIKVIRLERPGGYRMVTRRQPNHRTKRKRLKQKNSPTEPSMENDEHLTDLFSKPNSISSSEFVARTETSMSTREDMQGLEEYLTTVTGDLSNVNEMKNMQKFSRNSTTFTTPKYSSDRTSVRSTTEETAKVEIEEILNDTRTSARLSKILMERNMTLNELVEHRERGSSHVHLADIFHNTSKEPNPPEPFLSKSSIEPISKETYPLRALLDANHHDPLTRVTTLDPNPPQTQYIPVVMNFGNNVNENGENMGIMSLFTKLAGDMENENSTLNKDSEGTLYMSTVTSVDTTVKDETTRESRVLISDNDNLRQDVIAWKKLYELMRNNNNMSKSNSELPQAAEELLPTLPTETNQSLIVEEELDGDSIIVLEDLKHINNDITPGIGENLNVNYDRTDSTEKSGILDRMSVNTKSVTVATASIVGLSLILFLLTYAALKWKQQRSMLSHKQSFNEERIQTPVFENRKGHKNNCSTRSLSPMLTTPNIYSMNTLDSQRSSESPDYMWDTLRKPFQ